MAGQPRESTMSNASITSSVNGLIQQSFQWLDVDGENDDPTTSNDRPISLAPPNPAFRSDRSLNLRAIPPSFSSSSSSPLSLIAESNPSQHHQPRTSRTGNNTAISPPSRGASMQSVTSSTSSSTTSTSAGGGSYFPLFPTPPRPSAATTTSTSPSLAAIHETAVADHPSSVTELPYSHAGSNGQQEGHKQDITHVQPTTSHHSNARPLVLPSTSGQSSPPPFTLPPSPSTSTIRHVPQHQQQQQHNYGSQQQQPRSLPSSPTLAAAAAFHSNGALNAFASPSQPQNTRQLYDSPHSPRLPPSPGLPPSSSSSTSSPRLNTYSPQHEYPQFQQHPRQVSSSSSSANSVGTYGTISAAALASGIPLPSSPFNSQYSPLPNHPYPARTASIANSDRSFHQFQNQQQPFQSYHQQQQLPYPPSRNTSNTYLPSSDGRSGSNGINSPHQNPSPTHGAFPPATAKRAGAGGVLGYASSAPPGINDNMTRGAYTHANSTESTIWGVAGDGASNGEYYSPKGSEYDEKGFYNMNYNGNESFENRKEMMKMGMEADSGSSFIDHQDLKNRGSGMKKNGAAGGAFTGNKKKWWIIGGIIVLVIGAAVIGIVVYLTQRNSSKNTVASDSASDNSNNAADNSSSAAGKSSTRPTSTSSPSGNNGPATRGGDGSTITMENGQTFIYKNQFGGTWTSVPFDDSARAQSWSPALNERWDYSSNKIYGVNIGGWLHTEPFIAPALYEPFANSASPAVDEWSLSLALGDNLHDRMVEHFETFITEEDFAKIAGAGLNWVRIAIPYWAIEVYPGEPFLEGISWNYFLKAIEWARKYGLRINLDLHTIPGSQNGWNHSGKMGSIGFLNGAMGMANAQRTINYIRVITEFINQPEYRNVIPMWGIINEAQANVIGDEVIRAFYLEVYDMIREITGVGEGNGPVISLHDGFSGNLSTWNGFLTGSDRIVMDSHPYLAFDEPNADPYPAQMLKACDRWGPMFNLSMANVGFTYAGEFSLGVNDCGQYLNGVIDGRRYDGTYTGFPNVTGSCDVYMDVSLWDDDFRAQVLDFALASMDTFQNWFFWTWKIGESTVYNRVATPMWSYSLGLQEGYIPADPRVYHGSCPAMAEKYGLAAPESVPFDGSLEPWMTGGTGAGQILPTQIASYSQWPPISMANIPLIESLDVAELPTYTATATDLTLTGSPTPTTGRAATPVLTSPYFTPIAGCTNYLDPWGAAATTPTGIC